jgi:SAM-dependent methyltransferase
MTSEEISDLASSRGHAMSSAGHLDNRYIANRPEYEGMLRSAGIKSGWHVLDAGCGGGSFLPLMAELVGQDGQIGALDLAPENVNAVASMVARGDFPCPVETRIGSITKLPYPDHQFDAVWSANVSQYLTDEELSTAVAEFRRVVRPGGLVAIKDIDASGVQFQPLEPMMFSRLIAAHKRAGNAYVIGCLRGTRLSAWLRAAGLTEVWRQTTLIERWSPLAPRERTFIGDALRLWAESAEGKDIPADDRLIWQEVGEAPDRVMDDLDFCYRQLNIVAVGQVP